MWYLKIASQTEIKHCKVYDIHCLSFQDLRLLLPRCFLLYSQKKYTEFIECSKQVLFSQFKDIFQRRHLGSKLFLVVNDFRNIRLIAVSYSLLYRIDGPCFMLFCKIRTKTYMVYPTYLKSTWCQLVGMSMIISDPKHSMSLSTFPLISNNFILCITFCSDLVESQLKAPTASTACGPGIEVWELYPDG